MNHSHTEHTSAAPSPKESRLGSIDSSKLRQPQILIADDLATWKGTDLLKSEGFAEMTARRERIEELLERYSSTHGAGLSECLTVILDDWVKNSKIDGLMIATDDGLMVAKNSVGEAGEHMAAVAALFDTIVQRIQDGMIVKNVRELTLRGADGELVVVRNFDGLDARFFLLAYASTQVTYRMVTNKILKEAGILLSTHFE